MKQFFMSWECFPTVENGNLQYCGVDNFVVQSYSATLSNTEICSTRLQFEAPFTATGMLPA